MGWDISFNVETAPTMQTSLAEINSYRYVLVLVYRSAHKLGQLTNLVEPDQTSSLLEL